MTITLPINGIDVSYANAGDYSTPSALDFIFVKASDGVSTDPRWAQHSSYALRNRLVLGAYHFGRNDHSGAQQAAKFLSVIGSSTKLVALDIEGSSAITHDQARAFIAACKAKGKRVGVYHSLSGFPTGLGQDFNWVALWNGQTASPPIPWAFWQYTGGPLDKDFYHGSAAELRALAGLVVPPAPTPTPVGTLWAINITGATVAYSTRDATHVVGTIYSMQAHATRTLYKGSWWYQIVSARKYVGAWIRANGRFTATRI